MYQQNYNYQPQYGRISMPTGLKGRPVASLEEARASSIDFDGSVFYFPDLANKRIYTKQINMDGTSTLLMYELKELPIEQPQATYITREEFDTTINQLKSLLAPPTPVSPQINNVEPVVDNKPEFNF